jgi:transposase
MNVLGRELTQVEVAELERLARSQKSQVRYARRAQYILVANHHRYVCDAAREAEVDRRVLLLWCKRYRQNGLNGLLDKPRSGCPKTYSPEQVSKLVATALTPPSSLGLPFGEWTQQRLAEYLHQQGIGMSPTRVGVLLRREGLRWHTQESWYGHSETVAPDFVEKRGRLSGHTRNRGRTASPFVSTS